MTRHDHDVNRELEFHLEMLTRRYVDAGLDPDAARAKALARMGDLRAAARESQAIDPRPDEQGRRGPWIQTLLQDVGHGIRGLRRAPRYAVFVIVMLALGTGASTAVFSVVDGVILRSPFSEPDSVAMLVATGANGQQTSALPRDAYERIAANLPPQIAAVGVMTIGSPIVTRVDVPRRTQVECISASMVTVLGSRPQMGRWFTAADDHPGAPPVAVVSAKFWRDTLGSDPGVLGRSIDLDDVPVTIIGVMPRGFDGVYSRFGRDIWVPIGHAAATPALFGCRPPGPTVSATARLHPQVTMAAGTAALNAAASSSTLSLVPITEHISGSLKDPLNALVGAVIAVLLIAFANVANLGLERLAGRRRELAIRLALGATRARLVRETVFEHVVIAALAALTGVGIAALTFDAIIALLPPALPHLDAVSLNGRVLAASVGFTLLGGLGAGLVAAIQASSASVRGGMSAGDRGHTRGSHRARRILVASELAMAVVLLVSALLMIQTFVTLRPSAPGFDPSGKQIAHVRLPPGLSHQERLRFFEAVRGELSAIPGVRAVAGTSYVPMAGTRAMLEVTAGDLKGDVITGTVSSNYFDVMRIPVLRGRALNDADTAGSPAVAVVNDAFARRWLPGRDPLGATVTLDSLSTVPLTIVGVIGDVRTSGADTRLRPEIYLPLAQTMLGNPSFVVGADPRAAAAFPATMRAIVNRLRPGQLVDRVEAFQDLVDAGVSYQRLGAWLFGVFAALAVGLGAVGLAATLAWSVAQRRREIGIRMALGAQPGDVRRLVVHQTFWMSAIGVGAGLAAAGATTNLLKEWLYGVTPLDPWTFAACGALMLAISAVAAYVPTRRATRVNPVIALRGD